LGTGRGTGGGIGFPTILQTIQVLLKMTAATMDPIVKIVRRRDGIGRGR
jgi:hypothetical protein